MLALVSKVFGGFQSTFRYCNAGLVWAGVVFFMACDAAAFPEIGISFPPVATASQRSFTKDALQDLGIAHIRFAENWNRRGVEPDFDALIRRVADLHSAGIRILLTVQSDGPDAVCMARNSQSCLIRPDAPFEAYLSALLAAVGSQIDAIQFGNEWDNQFIGTTEEFLVLHTRFSDTVRRVAPELTIVLGGITGRGPYAYAYCKAGAEFEIPDVDISSVMQDFCVTEADRNVRAISAVSFVLQEADYDVADIHLYDAEGLWPSAVTWFAGLTKGRPVWVTEFGGPSPDFEPKDPAYHAERISAHLETMADLPVERAYYFKLTDDNNSYHSHSGLYDRRGREKPALEVFRNVLSQW